MDQARYFVVTAATGECCEELEYRQREVEQAPDDPEAWLRLGLARQRRNEDLQALDAYDRALALGPTLAQAHHNRGVSLQSLGRWTQAAEAYRGALRLNPRYVRAHRLAVAALDGGLVQELLVDRVKQPCPTVSGEIGDVLVRLLGEVDPVDHGAHLATTRLSFLAAREGAVVGLLLALEPRRPLVRSPLPACTTP